MGTGVEAGDMLLWICIGWVFASALVALMPMRWQYVPAVLLLAGAPVLIFGIFQAMGLWAALAGVLAFLSMYRHPLRYFWKKLTGQPVQVPR